MGALLDLLKGRKQMGRDRQSNGFLLTEKERKLLELVAEGWTDKRIAHFRNLSQHTIHNAMVIINRKLAARNRTHAVVIAMRRGEIFVD